MGDFSGGSDYLELSTARAPAAVPAVVAGRYHLGACLGSGSYGVVHRARDSVEERDVAVKLLSPQLSAARLRREVVALRGLRIAGVVQLIDDGITDGGQPFIVTELVDGKPFPVEPTPWASIKPLLCRLLLALEHIHRLGVLHLDVKPQNVLVTPKSEVVLLDFGLAGGPGLGDQSLRGLSPGTQRYRAPEHWRGVPPSRRSDLYAVGLMVYQALVGRLPERPSSRSHVLSSAQRAFQHFQQGARTPATSPDERGQIVLNALLARDPERRPASAGDALDQLAPGFARWHGNTSAASEHQSARWFAGPERICHLPSRAAAFLARRTGGDNARVQAELDDWLRVGLVVPEDGRLRVQESLFGRLTSAPTALSATLDGSAPSQPASVRTAAAAGLSSIQALHVVGQLDEAFRRTTTQLALVRQRATQPDLEERLLDRLARIALDKRTVLGLELALYELGRSRHRSDHIVALEQLVQSARDCERGHKRRCLALARHLTTFADLAVERRRLASWLRCIARFQPEQEAAQVQRACHWAHTVASPDLPESLEAHASAWQGGLAYRTGDFHRAAQLHHTAAAQARSTSTRLAGMLDEASARLELGDYPTVRQLAERVQHLAAEHHLALYEGRSEWLLRAIAYRTDAARAVDHELLAAVSHLGVPYLSGLIHLTEAAVAWRLAQTRTAHELASIAERHFQAAGWRPGQVLAHALRLTTHPAPERADVRHLAQDVCDQPIHDVDWQVLVLCRRVAPTVVGAKRVVARARQAGDPERRRDILAPYEALGDGACAWTDA